MYGQTEATARIAYVPPESLPAISTASAFRSRVARLRLLDEDGQPVESGVAGELAYRGPNVMMGYATKAAPIWQGRGTR